MPTSRNDSTLNLQQAVFSQAIRIIEVPCNQRWDNMAGTNDRRQCEQCQHSVHNLAAMSANAVQHLLANSPSKRLCVVYEPLSQLGAQLGQQLAQWLAALYMKRHASVTVCSALLLVFGLAQSPAQAVQSSTDAGVVLQQTLPKGVDTSLTRPISSSPIEFNNWMPCEMTVMTPRVVQDVEFCLDKDDKLTTVKEWNMKQLDDAIDAHIEPHADEVAPPPQH